MHERQHTPRRSQASGESERECVFVCVCSSASVFAYICTHKTHSMSVNHILCCIHAGAISHMCTPQHTPRGRSLPSSLLLELNSLQWMCSHTMRCAAACVRQSKPAAARPAYAEHRARRPSPQHCQCPSDNHTSSAPLQPSGTRSLRWRWRLGHLFTQPLWPAHTHMCTVLQHCICSLLHSPSSASCA